MAGFVRIKHNKYMRLYATTTSDKGGRPARKGGDTYIQVELYHGNDWIGTIEVQRRVASTSGVEVVWHSDSTPDSGALIEG